MSEKIIALIRKANQKDKTTSRGVAGGSGKSDDDRDLKKALKKVVTKAGGTSTKGRNTRKRINLELEDEGRSEMDEERIDRIFNIVLERLEVDEGVKELITKGVEGAKKLGKKYKDKAKKGLAIATVAAACTTGACSTENENKPTKPHGAVPFSQETTKSQDDDIDKSRGKTPGELGSRTNPAVLRARARLAAARR